MEMVFFSSPAEVAATATLFFIGFALSQLVCGLLSDALGRRRVGIAFLMLFVLSSTLSVVASSIEEVLFWRFLQGVGAAVGISTARALVRDWFVGQAATRVVNLMYLFLGAGPALAPVLGSFIAETMGFRAIFGFLAFYGLLLILFLFSLRPDPLRPDTSQLRFDLMARTFGRVLSKRSFMQPALAISGVSGALYGQSAILPFLLMQEVGLTTIGFGIAMMVLAGCHMLGSLSARFWLSRDRGVGLVPWAQATILGACVWMLLAAMSGPSLFGLVGPIALAAFAGAHSYPVFVSASVEDFPHDAGAAASLLGSFQMGAGFLVALMAGLSGPSIFPAIAGICTSLAVAGFMGLAWSARAWQAREV